MEKERIDLMNQRTQALAREDESIQRTVQALNEQKPRPTAIQAMASRLDVTPGKLQEILRNGPFKGANDNEFAALIVVANELGLNPLKKEIYGFATRGGIMPMIGYDGWISIANRHPQYDGTEQNEVFLEGKFVAVETIIHRKDRRFPTKKTIYLDEFKMNTEPWKQKPIHMTGMRSYCHAARLALGVSGVLVEDEYITIEGHIQQASVPTSRQLQQQEAQQQQHEPEQGYEPLTGEVFDDAETDAQIEREAGRLQGDEYEDQEADTANDVQAALDEPRWKTHYRDTLENVLAASSKADLASAEKEFVNHRATYDDDAILIVEREIGGAKKRLGPQ